MSNYQVNSEIGKLKKVLVHEPGEEIHNLIPEYLGDLLFDDIPWLPLAKKEHRTFANTFKEHGVEVLYLTDLVKQALDATEEAKEEFVNKFVRESGIRSETLSELVKDYLFDIKDTNELILKTIGGIKKTEIQSFRNRTLTDLIDDNPFLTDPIPNIYFQRDPFSVIGNGVCLNTMYSITRNRETLFDEMIFKYHPTYKTDKLYCNRNLQVHIEGGDIIVLNDHILVIGISQRTSSQAIEHLCKNLFYEYATNYDTVLALYIPKSRAFMHLDTVFTQVDYDKFAIHQECKNIMQIYEIKKSKEDLGKLCTRKLSGSVDEVIGSYINKKITLIPCGGGDLINAAREQWSDGANTLAIAPGEVITYERNNITNELLKQYGIKVDAIPSSELSRGRGGPRCMCMPLVREDIT